MLNLEEITEGDIERILSLLNNKTKRTLLNILKNDKNDEQLDSLFYGINKQLLKLIRCYKIEFYYLLAYYGCNSEQSKLEIKELLGRTARSDKFIRFIEDGTKYSTEDCKILDLKNTNFIESVEKIVIEKQEAPLFSYDDTNYAPQEFLKLLGEGFELNYVQRVLSNVAFNSDDDFLLCAPTGIGKTIIAAMRIFKLQKVKKGNLKVAYLAPIKALAYEIKSFLEDIFVDLNVLLAISDHSIEYSEVQKSNIIVGTPERIDLILRNTFIKFDLIIIDEIHILNDTRGYVIEGIVARCMRSFNTRLIGMSGTVYNYEDVGMFLGVKYNNVYVFGDEFRPSQITYDIALTDDIDAELDEVLCSVESPTVVFVHTQKDTLKTAEHVKQYFDRVEDLSSIIISQEDFNDYNNLDIQIKELIYYRLGVHHSGLNKNSKLTIERFFKKGIIKVLVSTSTLAWGVNLPIRSVIIKGSIYYNADFGDYVELSNMEIRQMFGRAGRYPGMEGCKGVLISSTTSNLYFNQTIESRILPNITNLVLAEVYLGINNFKDLMDWFSNTFYVTRLMKYNDNSFNLCKDILYTYLHNLNETKMLQGFTITDYGKISVKYYIDYLEIHNMACNIKPTITLGYLLDLIGQLSIFKNLKCSFNEDDCEIPCATTFGKLIQLYFNSKSIEDEVVNLLKQNFSRIMNAVLEVSLINGSIITPTLLEYIKAFDNNMKPGQTPFRHLNLPDKTIKDIESKQLPYKVLRKLKEEDFKSLELEGFTYLKYLPMFDIEVRIYSVNNDKMTLIFHIDKVFDDSKMNSSKYLVLVRDAYNTILLSETYYVTENTESFNISCCIPKRRFIQIELISYAFINSTIAKAFDLSLIKAVYTVYELKKEEAVNGTIKLYLATPFDTLVVYDQTSFEIFSNDIILVKNHELADELQEKGHKTCRYWEFLHKAKTNQLALDENYILINAHEVFETNFMRTIIDYCRDKELNLKVTGFPPLTRIDQKSIIKTQLCGFWNRIYDLTRSLLSYISSYPQLSHLIVVSDLKIFKYLQQQLQDLQVSYQIVLFKDIQIEISPKTVYDVVHLFDTQYLDYSTNQLMNYKQDTFYYLSRLGKQARFYLSKNRVDIYFTSQELQVPYKHKEYTGDLLAYILDYNRHSTPFEYLLQTGLSLESLRYFEENLKNNLGLKALLTLIFQVDELHLEVVDDALKDHKDVDLGLRYIKLDKLIKSTTKGDKAIVKSITSVIHVLFDMCSKKKFIKTMFNLIFIIQKMHQLESKFYTVALDGDIVRLVIENEPTFGPVDFYFIFDNSEYERVTLNFPDTYYIRPRGCMLYVLCNKIGGYDKIEIK